MLSPQCTSRNAQATMHDGQCNQLCIAARGLRQPQCMSRNPWDGSWIAEARGLRRLRKRRLCAANRARLYGPLFFTFQNNDIDNNRVLKFELHVKKEIHLLFNFQIKLTTYFSLCLSICVCLSAFQFSIEHSLPQGMFVFVNLSSNSLITTISLYLSVRICLSVFFLICILTSSHSICLS